VRGPATSDERTKLEDEIGTGKIAAAHPVSSTGVDGRAAWIRAATTGWVDLTLRPHCVSTTLLDDDPNAAELEDEIRALALVAHEYLTGGGRVVQQRAWIRKRHVVVIETIHGEWILSHRSSKNPDL
jgi:hypothetical protein